uniref:BTB domain-containing protein n=1 Tax=Panagrolaimus sp. ES5 TaxID=591445 RepID=A0AC34G0C4_9BILA
MKDVFLSKDGTDVTFVIHGKELHAHKLIVTARSPVFKAMIEGPMAPADQRHLINDPKISFGDFEIFLQFLYTDELDMEKSRVKALLHLGSFYNVPYFIEQCVVCIRALFINRENVLEFGELGIIYAPSLLEICLNVLSRCLSDYDAQFAYRLDDGKLKWISAELMLEIVVKQREEKYSMFGITEDEMFKKVLNWAENQCFVHQDQQIAPENVRAIMAQFMPFFNPKNLLPTTLTTTIKKYKLIPDDELNDCFAGHIAKMIETHRHLNIPLSENIPPRREHRRGDIRGGRDEIRPGGFAPPHRYVPRDVPVPILYRRFAANPENQNRNLENDDDVWG